MDAEGYLLVQEAATAIDTAASQSSLDTAASVAKSSTTATVTVSSLPVGIVHDITQPLLVMESLLGGLNKV